MDIQKIEELVNTAKAKKEINAKRLKDELEPELKKIEDECLAMFDCTPEELPSKIAIMEEEQRKEIEDLNNRLGKFN